MKINECNTAGTLVGRVPHGADLLGYLTEVCEKSGVTLGAVSLIGAVSRAQIAYYDQEKKEYRQIGPFEEALEIVSASGNVSLKDGVPFVHLHAVFARESGECVGGHLTEGTTVFACEYTITKLDGPRLERGHDGTTGLFLWKE